MRRRRVSVFGLLALSVVAVRAWTLHHQDQRLVCGPSGRKETRSRHTSKWRLFAKKRKRVDRETAFALRKAQERSEALRRNGRATDVAPAALTLQNGAIVEEDHNHEQFFFDASTLKRLASLALCCRRPLLMCAPSLAAFLDARDASYVLLDRDVRFRGLVRHFLDFDLRKPEHYISTADLENVDAIFLDPPFANVSPRDLAAAVDHVLLIKNRLLSRVESCAFEDDSSTTVIDHELTQKATPLFVGYNRKRADDLVAAFAGVAGGLAATSVALHYASGVMPNQIVLFANPAGQAMLDRCR